jgi:hypothetical protein
MQSQAATTHLVPKEKMYMEMQMCLRKSSSSFTIPKLLTTTWRTTIIATGTMGIVRTTRIN